MALQKKTRGVVRLYQGISEIVADIWRPTVKDGLRHYAHNGGVVAGGGSEDEAVPDRLLEAHPR
jgi:hypothetical protein